MGPVDFCIIPLSLVWLKDGYVMDYFKSFTVFSSPSKGHNHVKTKCGWSCDRTAIRTRISTVSMGWLARNCPGKIIGKRIDRKSVV